MTEAPGRGTFIWPGFGRRHMNFFQRSRHVLGARVDATVNRLSLWALKGAEIGRIDDIGICDISVGQEHSREAFLQLTREALQLIKTMDPRRYRRVRTYLKYIVNTALISGGTFDRRCKVCNVDYTKYFTTNDPLRNLRSYAKLLIHEATHGLVFEAGIPYDKKNRERIERLCNLEEYRFSLRFEVGYAEAHRSSFDAEYYQWYWEGSKRSKLAAGWTRWREAFRLRKKKYDAPPQDAKSYNELGRSFQKKGESDKAISYFSHAIQLDPAFAGDHYNRAREYHSEGRYDEALADYERAIQLAPRSVKSYFNRGLTYRHLGEYDRAIEDYTPAIELDPEYPNAYNNRGYAYHCKRDYDRALADYDRAIQIVPHYELAFFNRARTYRALKNYGKAIADYNRVTEFASHNAAAAYRILAGIWAAGPAPDFQDPRKAIEFALKSCDLYHWKNASAIQTLAQAYAAAGDFENAVKWQTRYLEMPALDPDEVANARTCLAGYQNSTRISE